MHHHSTAIRACSMLAAITPVASAHFDIYVGNDGSRITTGGIDVDTSALTPGLRVFGADLGEFPIPPGFGDEPGFFSTTFLPGASVAFDIVDGLRAWNGSDFSTLATQSLTVTKGLSSVSAPSTYPGFVSGFPFATADGAGALHDHLDFELTPSDDVGIYLLAIRLRTDVPAIGPSETVWIVFNNSEEESIHDEAVAWVETNLVPGPSVCGIASICGAASARRRRR